MSADKAAWPWGSHDLKIGEAALNGDLIPALGVRGNLKRIKSIIVTIGRRLS